MIEKGLFKRLENIENAQKGLINDINKPDSVRSKSSISSTFDSISSKSKDEDEQENEKTADELYQNSGIEGMKGLILPGEEIKNEKSQMYLENNLNKIKNNFSDKYQSISLMEKKTILTMKYFQLKLKLLIFLIDMVLCTII